VQEHVAWFDDMDASSAYTAKVSLLPADEMSYAEAINACC
jgi:hypothetical protein